ncbi:DNA recombination protein RmuC [Actinomycetaceae bacterium MB13-C1-2]|nr:DNA recombination protein RmuC [Actinomycetaceae bacterium MB13-C1-2]
MSAEVILMTLAVLAALVAAIMAGLVWIRLGKDDSEELLEQSQAIFERTQMLASQVQTVGQVQAERIYDLREVVDGRLMRLEEQSRNDATRRTMTDAEARQELKSTLNERMTQMETKISELEKSLSAGLELIRTSNAAELDKMRATVDEKLQGTLEKRLGESFKLVSERLEQVQRGLGEMQTLATDVGGLKRVLTNVKSRGTWGEVQLSRQLGDILAPDQYQENVQIKPNSGERVEFAVRLPGQEDGSAVYLPIDSKFPQEPYERLLDAQEHAESADVAAATKELEKALRNEAKRISGKYIEPPISTDFAIMYLPTEGLFAEAVRIPGLASALQRDERVMLTGPTTLMSLLNSLQMGFRTLAIEKRTSEVWQALATAKEEFAKYGGVMDKLKRHLQTAQNTVDEVGVRTRAINRSLKAVGMETPSRRSEGLEMADQGIPDFEISSGQ